MRSLSLHSVSPGRQAVLPPTVEWSDWDRIAPFDKQDRGDSWRRLDIHVQWDSKRQAAGRCQPPLLFAAVKHRTKEERTAEDETRLAALLSTYCPASVANPPSHSRLQTNWIKTWRRMIQRCTHSSTCIPIMVSKTAFNSFKTTFDLKLSVPFIAVLEHLIVSQNLPQQMEFAHLPRNCRCSKWCFLENLNELLSMLS